MPVSEDGEEWGGCVCVIGPAEPGGAPQLQEVSQTDGSHKCQHRGSVTRGTDDNQDARQCRQDGQWLIHRRPHEGQLGHQEHGEDDPVAHDPQLARYAWAA